MAIQAIPLFIKRYLQFHGEFTIRKAREGAKQEWKSIVAEAKILPYRISKPARIQWPIIYGHAIPPIECDILKL